MPAAALVALGEEESFRRAGDADKERQRRLDGVPCVGLPLVAVESDEEHRVVLKLFAPMDRQEWDSVLVSESVGDLFPGVDSMENLSQPDPEATEGDVNVFGRSPKIRLCAAEPTSTNSMSW